jgi:cathepsin D
MFRTLIFAVSVLPWLAQALPALPTTDFSPDSTLHVQLARRDGVSDIEHAVVDLQRIQNALYEEELKILRGYAAAERNAGGVIAHASPPATPSTGGLSTLRLIPDRAQSMWYGNISVGTPPKTYSGGFFVIIRSEAVADILAVDFDTGSSDLFLPGPACTSSYCAGHHQYDPRASSTAKPRNQQFELDYADGSQVLGSVYTDVVHFGTLAVAQQAVGAADTYSSSLAPSQFTSDGLLGLAFRAVSAFDQDPFFVGLWRQGQLADAVFAFRLRPADAQLTLGGADAAAYKGAVSYANVTEAVYWKVGMDAVSVNGVRTLDTRQAIIDSGTTLVMGAMADVQKIYAAIKGARSATDLGMDAGFYTSKRSSVRDATAR